MVAQPPDQLGDDVVAPHPPREAHEVAERRLGVPIVADALDVAVGPCCRRPVRLDRHAAKVALGDQPLGQLRAQGVELVRAVRRLAEQHEPRLSDRVEEILDGPCMKRGHDNAATRAAAPGDAPPPAAGHPRRSAPTA